MIAMRIPTSLICFAFLILMASHEAKAVDWCSSAPRPKSARPI
jgi:hypothetical protein